MIINKLIKKAKILAISCKKQRANIYRLVFVILYPMVVTVMMGYVIRYTFKAPFLSSLRWIYKFPVPFAINCLIILSLTTLFWLLTKKKVFSVAITSTLTAILSLINYFKMSIRGEPVYPGDFLFPGEAANIAGGTKLVVPISIILFLVTIIIISIASSHVKILKLGKKKRALCFLVLLAISLSSYPLFFANTKVQKAIGVEDAIWNQVYNYEKNGLLNAFLMQVKYLHVNKPIGYSKQNAEKLLSSVDNKKSSKPNIIIIMNESFWDPVRLTNVKFNIDPLENFRKIQQQSIYGDLLVEPFGGNTANTEFEALTGFSMNALPGGVAYQQYVKRELPALPSLLKKNGYSTVAIHPYDDWFWNRKVVYPLLGIDNFISKNDFLKDDYKGSYVSDSAVSKRIIKDYESSKPDKKPYFAHAVTMQNHGWYDADRYKGGEQEVVASSSLLGKQMLLELGTYAQGTKDASDSLADLVNYFSKVNDPTIIVFFGDHLPSIGNDYGLYRSSGYVGKNDFSDGDYSKLHQTPFLMWSNTTQKSQNIGVMNPGYIVPTMIKNFRTPSNEYFEYLKSGISSAKACNKVVCIDKSGEYISTQSEPFNGEIINQAILQYYYMFD